MKNLLTSLYLLSFTVLSAQGPYAPPAGQPGSTAVHKDSSAIISWATGIEIYQGWVNIADTSVKYNGSNKATFGYPAMALGNAQGGSTDVVSLGDAGIAVLTFDRPIINGPGPDFAIFENGLSDTFLELAFVEVSSDGNRFVRFPSVSLTPADIQVGGFGSLDATNIHNLAGKYRQGYGTPFDLDDVKDSTGVDTDNIRFVRVIDVTGNIDDIYATFDSRGNKVNDPWPTPFHSCGFDLDAVSILHGGSLFEISNFNDLSLTEDSYWDGNDLSGGFSSNTVFFKNDYDSYSSSFYGFIYSNMSDAETPGYSNQYSAITAGGMDAMENGGTNYSVACVPVDWMSGTFDMLFTEAVLNSASYPGGFYVTNSTYAFLSMKTGDQFAKKFGGEDGNDPDYFKLLVWGEKENGTETDTVEFFLADFRFEDNTRDYFVTNWQWVDLTGLGKVKKLRFSLESSDMGDWGMNNPAYFCMDNLTLITDEGFNKFRLENPLPGLNVEMNSARAEIDISNVFTANDTTGIQFNVESNSNAELVSVQLSGEMMMLTFSADLHGEAEIVLSATLNYVTLTDTFKVKVTCPTGILNGLPLEYRIYPNPFTSTLNVECVNGIHVVLFDLFGRKIGEKVSEGGAICFPTDHLAPGYYILRLTMGQEVQTLKILKH